MPKKEKHCSSDFLVFPCWPSSFTAFEIFGCGGWTIPPPQLLFPLPPLSLSLSRLIFLKMFLLFNPCHCQQAWREGRRCQWKQVFQKAAWDLHGSKSSTPNLGEKQACCQFDTTLRNHAETGLLQHRKTQSRPYNERPRWTITQPCQRILALICYSFGWSGFPWTTRNFIF